MLHPDMHMVNECFPTFIPSKITWLIVPFFRSNWFGKSHDQLPTGYLRRTYNNRKSSGWIDVWGEAHIDDDELQYFEILGKLVWNFGRKYERIKLLVDRRDTEWQVSEGILPFVVHRNYEEFNWVEPFLSPAQLQVFWMDPSLIWSTFDTNLT